jgi:hypothetical protein
VDFLPFTCDCCSNVFCLEHRSYDAHRCPKAGASVGKKLRWARRGLHRVLGAMNVGHLDAHALLDLTPPIAPMSYPVHPQATSLCRHWCAHCVPRRCCWWRARTLTSRSNATSATAAIRTTTAELTIRRAARSRAARRSSPSRIPTRARAAPRRHALPLVAPPSAMPTHHLRGSPHTGFVALAYPLSGWLTLVALSTASLTRTRVRTAPSQPLRGVPSASLCE